MLAELEPHLRFANEGNIMSLLTIFISGVIVGWAAEWQLHRRRKGRDNEQLECQLTKTQAQLNSLRAQQEERDAMSNRSRDATSRDRLEQIKGIGPVFARRLNEEGIFTFADLATLSPERVREMVSDGNRITNIDAQAWIVQAQQLAAGC
jgi:predicted flap endonuclease-1-like 5' DNA nuclease